MLHRIAVAALLLLPVPIRAEDGYDALVKEFQNKLPARGVISEKDGKEFAGKFLEFAAKNENDPNAADALGRILQIGRLLPEETQAADLLVQKYAKSDKLPEIIERLGGYWTPARETALRGIWEKGSGDAKLLAAFRLMQQLKTRAMLAIDLKEEGKLRIPIYGNDVLATIERSDLKQMVAEAEKLAKDLEDSKVLIGGKTPAGEVVPRIMVGFRNLPSLLVGQTAPALEGVDLEGKKQSLKDLRGKVVVVDIWATWCPPCRAMIPHENELVERLKDKPFALVSISADEQKETLTKFLEKTKMPWTHWHNGNKGGVLDAWNIRYFPTIYVIDGKGVIRYKGVRGKAMDEAVDTLLKEMDASGQ